MDNNLQQIDTNNQINQNTIIELEELPEINNGINCSSLSKKIRTIVINEIIDFTNRKIKFYLKDINRGIFIKQFLDIDKSDLSHSNVDFDKKFIHFKLKDIFSKDISKKITRYFPGHNRNLLHFLIIPENEGSYYFSQLFDLSFLDCLEHIRGSKNIELLNGMKNMEEIFESYKSNKNYYDSLIKNMTNYEIYLNRKKSRTK